MGIDIAFYLYDAKRAYSIPLEPVLSYFKTHGADCQLYEAYNAKSCEISFPLDSIDSQSCILYLDAEDRATTIFMERPGGPAFKELAFGLMQKFGYWFLEGGISAIYHVHGSGDDLPDSIHEVATCKPAKISKPDDIWSIECEAK